MEKQSDKGKKKKIKDRDYAYKAADLPK